MESKLNNIPFNTKQLGLMLKDALLSCINAPHFIITGVQEENMGRGNIGRMIIDYKINEE